MFTMTLIVGANMLRAFKSRSWVTIMKDTLLLAYGVMFGTLISW